jgi:hypothetical protein
MYLAVIILLMGVLPVLSIAVEALSRPDALLVILIGKWFVFWSVGARLVLAGVRQIANPAFTARAIFAIDDPKALILVRELGFGTLSIGLIGIAALAMKAWVVPAAIACGLFYGLAGIQHAASSHRSRLETIAMISDLFIFIVLAAWLVARGSSAQPM